MGESAPAGLDITVSRATEGVVLVLLEGELDLVSCALLRARLGELEPLAGAHIVVDLAGLTFVDSSGINALVQTANAVKGGGGSMILAAPTTHVRRVFEIARVGDAVTVARERGEALASPLAADVPDAAPDELR